MKLTVVFSYKVGASNLQALHAPTILSLPPIIPQELHLPESDSTNSIQTQILSLII